MATLSAQENYRLIASAPILGNNSRNKTLIYMTVNDLRITDNNYLI